MKRTFVGIGAAVLAVGTLWAEAPGFHFGVMSAVKKQVDRVKEQLDRDKGQAAQAPHTPQGTPTISPTSSATPTISNTATASPSGTATPTASSTSTATGTFTETPTETCTPSPSVTKTCSATSVATATATTTPAPYLIMYNNFETGSVADPFTYISSDSGSSILTPTAQSNDSPESGYYCLSVIAKIGTSTGWGGFGFSSPNNDGAGLFDATGATSIHLYVRSKKACSYQVVLYEGTETGRNGDGENWNSATQTIALAETDTWKEVNIPINSTNFSEDVYNSNCMALGCTGTGNNEIDLDSLKYVVIAIKSAPMANNTFSVDEVSFITNSSVVPSSTETFAGVPSSTMTMTMGETQTMTATYTPSPTPSQTSISYSTASIITLAGGGSATYTIDGCLGTAALLNNPRGLTVDGEGNVYFCDYYAHVICELVKSSGLLKVIAGTGTGGYSGDGGAATSAGINGPYGIVLDNSDNLIFTDTGNHRVRKIEKISGNIYTIAGTGERGYSGDGGTATMAALNFPYGISLDVNENIYISDSSNSVVRKIDAGSGVIQTIVSGLDFPWDIFVGSAGDIYISLFYNSVIFKYLKNGSTLIEYAGKGNALATGVLGDGGLATSAELSSQHGVSVDANENLFVADTNNNRIRVVWSSTGLIDTVAGTGVAGYSGDGGLAKAANISSPNNVFVDGLGNVYFSDTGNGRIRKIIP